MTKNKIIYIGILLILTLFLCACSGRALQQETQANSAASEPTLAVAPTMKQAPSGADALAFGRYAAALHDTIYFARDKGIVSKTDDKEQFLFALPADGAIEDVFAAQNGELYFSMRLEENKGFGRLLYSAILKDGSYVLDRIATMNGPMIANGEMIYYMKNERLMSYNCSSHTSSDIAQLNSKIELFDWGYFDGQTLYYSVYDAMENGTPYGASKLYSFKLADQRVTLIGERNKPYTSEFLLGQNGALYILTDNVDRFDLHIIDSQRGEIKDHFSVPKTILGSVGAEKIIIGKDAVYLLLGSDASSQQSGFCLTAYKVAADACVKLWTNDFPQAIACYEIDQLNETISVLTEGNDQVEPMLYNLNLDDGKINRQRLQKGLDRLKAKMIRTLDGSDLIYSTMGEDLPQPILESVTAE